MPLKKKKILPRDYPGTECKEAIKDQIAHLSGNDKRLVGRVIRAIANRLGSYTAACLWLECHHDAFGKSPLEVIREGNAKGMFNYTVEMNSPFPPYA